MADAYVKGVRGAVNWTAGYEAMLKNAEVAPVNNNDPRDPSSSTKEGRGALPDWLELGYITPKYGRAVTRAVEYSVNDFSLSQVAAGLGKTADVEKYINRSRNWRNHWNPAATSLNFSGFVVPRSRQGYIEQDPLQCGGCYWGDAYYEGLPWEYSFNAQHDIDALIALSGGPGTFVNRLEMMFKPNITSRNAAFNGTIFNPGNEPSFNTPYLYNYVGRQDLSVKQSRNIAKSYYNPTPGGLPGNSDAGAMESWLLWNMLGLYPMVGQTTFLIGSPWFANTTISLGAGKALSMTTTGGSNGSYYVQSLQVNGKQWTQSWVTWDEIFANGGTMDFVLGPEPKNWTTGPPPPSPASEFGQYTNGSVIVRPGAVPIAPSAAVLAKEAHRRRVLRDVALGIMGFVILALLGLAGWMWWYWTRKMKRDVTGEQNADQEKGVAGLAKSLVMRAGLKSVFSNCQDRLLKAFGKKGPQPMKEEARPRSADDSIGGETFVDVDVDRPISEKKELRVSVLEACYVQSEPTEPWTPRGMNRRINDIPEERTES
jgi:hypothetical protein